MNREELGKKLKEQRKKLGVKNLHEMAERSGLHHITLNRLETGSIPHPEMGTLLKIAKAYAIDFDELLAVFTPSGRTDDVLAKFMKIIQSDARFAHIAKRAQKESIPHETKLLMIRMYEELTGKPIEPVKKPIAPSAVVHLPPQRTPRKTASGQTKPAHKK